MSNTEEMRAKLFKVSDVIGRYKDVMIAFALVLGLGLMLIPVWAPVLDFFLSINIAFSILILMGILYIKDPLDLSAFPAILLISTIYRLGLNVSTTRLILGSSPPYAGDMVNAFGSFVSGNNIVVGFVMFLIFIIINFIVITKGATRIAEVSARFTLDAMPGKQMSIDADLNAGLIDEAQARERRNRIVSEAEFYGSMDGASKFVRGDAIAGIIITVINILGGFIIGVAMNDMEWSDALQTYTMLTIGDGLVSQVPSLILSTAAGLLVTRSNENKDFGSTLVSQVVTQPGPRAIAITGIVVFLMALTPLPGLPLSILGIGCGGMAYIIQESLKKEKQAAIKEKKREEKSKKSSEPDDVESMLKVDAMGLEVGYGLIPLVDTSQGGDLLTRITNIRRQLVNELGVVVPPIRIRDNMQLESNAYRICIRGSEMAAGTVYPDKSMAMDSGLVETKMDGIDTKEPAFGMPALWIDDDQKEEAQMLGYTVVDTTSVITTHITEIIKQYSHELLTREEVNKLIVELKKHASAVVEEVIDGNVITKGELQQVLRNLLSEKVSIRNMETILETLGDYATKTKDIEILTEYVRNALAREICVQHRDENNIIHVIMLDPSLEEQFFNAIERSENGSYLKMAPDFATRITNAIAGEVETLASAGHQPILLTSATIRAQVKQLTSRPLPSLVVLSQNELVKEVDVESVGMVTLG